MTQDLVTATMQLTQTLTAENDALRGMDLPRAAGLLADKEAALAAFNAARAVGATSPAMQLAAAELRKATDENRRLLEQAIGVQTRVLGIIAQAAHGANPAPRYGRSGAYAARPVAGWALSARA
jgi:hypothetical protein